MEAISSVSAEAYENYLDTTFLADGSTSIRVFLTNNPLYLDGVEVTHSYKNEGNRTK